MGMLTLQAGDFWAKSSSSPSFFAPLKFNNLYPKITCKKIAYFRSDFTSSKASLWVSESYAFFHWDASEPKTLQGCENWSSPAGHETFHPIPKLKEPSFPIPSVGLVYLPTWMVDLYGCHVGKCPMDPMGLPLFERGEHPNRYSTDPGSGGTPPKNPICCVTG